MNLKEIKYQDLIFNSTLEDLEKIVFLNNYPKVSKETDYGVLFGGVGMIPYRVLGAIKLYYEGLIKKIFLSGGVGYLNFNRLKTESYYMYKYLRTKEIPDSDIIIEDKSRDTFENIQNLIEIIRKESSLATVNFTLITSDFHLKRCIQTLKKLLGNSDNIYGYPVYDQKTDCETWKKSFYGKMVILKEALLLCYYAKKNLLKDQAISNLSYENRKNKSFCKKR